MECRDREAVTRSGAGSLVLLGLGANQGDPIGQIRRAVDLLGASLSELTVSSLYRSAPVGYREQADFLNLVCRGRTTLSPPTLLAEVQRIEQLFGRTRTFPNAPRTLDIDILAYGDQRLDNPELTIPHPRLAERAFVLVPLAEVAPEWRHPVLGLTAAEILQTAGTLERIERIGAFPDP
jgi:2-amino-4-hydroxy-6-hydroxymethyldihydropteridine diphosphokinase